MYISDFTDSCSMATTDKCNRVVLDVEDAFNYKSLFEVNTIIFRLSHPQKQIKASMKKFRNEQICFSSKLKGQRRLLIVNCFAPSIMAIIARGGCSMRLLTIVKSSKDHRKSFTRTVSSQVFQVTCSFPNARPFQILLTTINAM